MKKTKIRIFYLDSLNIFDNKRPGTSSLSLAISCTKAHKYSNSTIYQSKII